MKSIKRTVAITVLSALLMSGFALAIPQTASAAYDNNYTFTINGTNTTPPSSSHSNVYLYTNTTNSVKTITWNTYDFRNSKLMIFNSQGRIVECGGNITSEANPITGAAQLTLTVPANGFMIAFGQNNTNLMKAYDVAMEGAMLYNSTMSVIYELYASYSGNTLTIKYNNPKPASANSKSFLFVGNSTTYFNGTPIKFKAMAQAAGIEVDVTYCTMGSALLDWFVDENHDAGKKLRSLLNSKKFDYVVLQDASVSYYAKTRPAIDKLMPLIKANGAEALLYMCYSTSTDFEVMRADAYKHNQNYTRVASELNLACAPVADAFVYSMEKYPAINLYASDIIHHSKEGSYLVAATWLYTYLGVNPVGNTYTADMSADTVSKLQECAKLACDVPYPYPDYTPTYTENGVKYKNIALNKKYDVNGSVYSGTWTDASKTKYTDGIISSNGTETTNGCWKGTTVDVTVNLEDRYNIKNVLIDMYGNTGWGIADPADMQMKVAISDDGKVFTDIGIAKMGAEKVDGAWKFREFSLITGRDDLAGKYVRLSFSNTKNPSALNHLWMSEIRIFGNKSDSQGEEFTNVALDKTYTGGEVSPAGTNYSAKLTDGVAHTIGSFDSNWYAFYYNKGATADKITAPDGVGTIIIDLEKVVKDITDVRVHVWNCNSNGISPAKSIKLFTSKDGESYTEIGNLAIPESNDPDWATISTDNISAQYVKIVIDTQSTWTFLNEIEVLTAPEAKPTNLVLGKDYEGTHNRSEYYANLTDGKAKDSISFVHDEWFGFYYHTGLTNEENLTDKNSNAPNGIGTVAFDLDGKYDLTQVRVNTFLGNYSGISAPYYIAVETSDNGTDYKEVARQNFTEVAADSADAKKVAWVEFNLSDVKANYVRLIIDTRNTQTFINEIEVYGVAAKADEPETSEPETSEPETSEPETSEPESSEPETSTPETSEPETSEPETSEPEVSDDEIADIDEDGDIDAADYVLVKRSVLKTYTLSEKQTKVADVDKDNDVDATDYVLVKRIVLGTYKIK